MSLGTVLQKQLYIKAITENVANEVASIPKGKELFAVVKANGYGHGAIETAEAAVAGGASVFVYLI